MQIIRALLLGVVQGLTEFLPVSSSGHLVLTEHLLPGGFSDAVAFDVCLHFGTLLAVLVYFRDDLLGMLAEVTGRGTGDEPYLRRWVGLLTLATIPLVIFALLFRSQLVIAFESTRAVGVALFVTAGLLFVATQFLGGERKAGDLGVADALFIGLFQAVAVVPGISRSGATITGALCRGVERATAARFAFLMSLPAIGGAMVGNWSGVGQLLAEEPAAVAAGTAAAALTGWLAIDLMMRAVRMGRLLPFALYCTVLGVAALLSQVG